MDNVDLEAIKQRLSRATKGRWVSLDNLVFYINHDKGFCAETKIAECQNKGAYNNAAFIAHAHQDIKLLVEEVEELRQSNDLQTFILKCLIAELQYKACPTRHEGVCKVHDCGSPECIEAIKTYYEKLKQELKEQEAL